MIGKMLEAADEGAARRPRSVAASSLSRPARRCPAASTRPGAHAFRSEIYDGIGSAEMFHIYVTNRPGDVKEGSLGKIVEGYSYELIDDDGQGRRAR